MVSLPGDLEHLKEEVVRLDVGPPLRKARSAGETVEIPSDGHWTAEGHRIVTLEIATLVEKDLLTR